VVTFASVGNVEARVLGSPGPVNFVVRRGVLGGEAPKPVVTEHPWQPGWVLVLHSDGLTTHWQWGDVCDLADSPAPALAARLRRPGGRPPPPARARGRRRDGRRRPGRRAMSETELRDQLAAARETIRDLQDELAETNRGLVALTLELEARVDARTADLREAHA